MKKIILLFLTGLLCTGALLAQSTGALQNSWLHLDKPFYVTADELGFQLYLAPEFAKEDIVIQSILFDATGEAQLYAYWSNERSSVVPGKIIIPNELATGWYYLSFRVWDSERATERVLLQAPLAIYNDETSITPDRVSQQEPTRQTAIVEIPEKELTITIANLPTTLASKSTTQFDVQVTDRRGRPISSKISVSISDWGLMGVSQAMGMDNLQQSDSLRVVTPANLSDQLFWQGELLTKNGDLPAQQNLYFKIGAKEQQLRTDDRGRIFWETNRQRARVPLQFLNADGASAQWRFRPAPGRLALGQLFYSPAAFRYLEVNRQRKAITTHIDNVQPTLPTIYQNPTTPSVLSTLVGVDGNRETNWQYNSSTLTAATTLLWQTGDSNEDGIFKLDYLHPTETTAYRIDIVAQDATGRRGRVIAYYRVGGE